MSVHPLEAEKLAIPRRAEMCKAIFLRWVPSMEALLSRACLNHGPNVDSIFSSNFRLFTFLHNSA